MTERRRSPRFADTRALVRIALADGWTQGEIARKCRTVQSTVSRWASGQSLGSEQQLGPLIEQFGHRLNRNAGAVYRVVGPRACLWEESPEATQLAELCAPAPLPEARPQTSTGADQPDEEDIDSLDVPDASENFAQYEIRTRDREAIDERLTQLFGTRPKSGWAASPESLERVFRSEYAAATSSIVRIDGPVLFRHTFEAPARAMRRNAHGSAVATVKMRPVGRWVVHRAGRRHFRLARLSIAVLHGLARVRWLLEADAALNVCADPLQDDAARRAAPRSVRERGSEPDLPTGEVFSRDDAGRWTAKIEGPFELDELLANCDALVAEDGGPNDERVVPFLLRKALLDQGYTLDDIERLGPISE